MGFEGIICHCGRANEEPPLITTQTDVARGAIGQAAMRELATGSNDRFAQAFVRHRATGIGHSAPRRSGYRLSKPARLAGQTPRSVINAVTKFAGVTSNARLSAGLASGTTLTVSMAPEEVRPLIWVSSSGDRSSIGISPPRSRNQSMVLTGSAA